MPTVEEANRQPAGENLQHESAFCWRVAIGLGRMAKLAAWYDNAGQHFRPDRYLGRRLKEAC